MTNQLLGTFSPAFQYWISELHSKLIMMSELRGRKVLFCTRAGKRIHDLLYVHSTQDELPYATELFGISRIAACKVAADQDATFQLAYEVTAESLGNATLADVCRAYLRSGWDLTNPHIQALSRLRQPFTRDSFRALIASNDPAARYFRDILTATRVGLERWLEEQLDGHSGYVLVDTGWKGSIQKLLRATYPQFGFEGFYFGVMDPNPAPDRFGLVFDAPSYDPKRPETAFALHRHLIEAALEPEVPSVEDTPGGPFHDLSVQQVAAVANEEGDEHAELFYYTMANFIFDNSHLRPDHIYMRFRQSLPKVTETLLFPTRTEALHLGDQHRTIDFGRAGIREVLILDERMDREERQAQSLWPQGQIALDYDPIEARQRQEAIAAKVRPDYFAGHEDGERTHAAAAAAKGKPDGWEGSVAVITRTKDRPLLLARAAWSVASQDHANMHWVIVNDGGDPGPVRAIARDSGVAPSRITLIENPKSVGMEAASNQGVRASDTEYVVIHDDDDSWEPSFVSSCVAFLHSPRAAAAGFEGVVTRAWRVSEEIVADAVIEHHRVPYMPWVSEVPLAQMAVGNFFAPISFLFRRWVYDAVGGYDEALPVLGDWRFNLEFLARANIGLLDAYLSAYHHRDTGATPSVYANSVIGAQSLHAQYTSVVVNKLLRDPAASQGLALALVTAHQQRVMEQRMNALDAQIAGMKAPDPRSVSETEGDGAAEAAPGEPVLSLEDKAHILSQVERHLIGSSSTGAKTVADGHHVQDLARLRAALATEPPVPPKEWQELIAPHLAKIATPLDFDHIAYLDAHPDIWATEYNAPGGLGPYHHYLMAGITEGRARPVMPPPRFAPPDPVPRRHAPWQKFLVPHEPGQFGPDNPKGWRSQRPQEL